MNKKTKTIGDKIKELLEIRGMNQADLAKRCEMSSGLISEYINNKRTGMNVVTLQKISKALGIHASYFLEDEVIGPADILPHLTEEERDFVLNKKSLPWLKVTQEAERKGLTPEKIRQMVDIMSE